MGQPVFSDLFAFSGRRNRQSFILFQIAIVGIWLVVHTFILDTIVGIAMFVGLTPSIIIILLVGGGMLTSFWNLVVTAQRFRDMGWTGWAALLIFIPIVNLVCLIALIFVPGTRGANKYGPDPL